MRSGSPLARYRAEAAHALSRLQHYQACGDQRQVDLWHRAWSLAAEAVDAESGQQGGGAGVLRRRSPLQLRPLPPAPASSIPVPSETPPAVVEPEEEAMPARDPVPVPEPIAAAAALFKTALERHERLDRALRAGGPNPFPEELEEGEWQYHLTAFRVEGPLDCELLQSAEAAVEALVDQYPELLPADEAEPAIQPPAGNPHLDQVTLSECLRIYQESLAELTEDELRADLENCLQAGRADTAAVIEAELRHREWESPPELPSLLRSVETQNRKGVNTTDRKAPATEPLLFPQIPGAISEGRVTDAARHETPAAAAPGAGKPGPRRRTAVYSTTAPPDPPPVARKPPKAAANNTPEAPTAPAYTTTPAWIDAAGRTRTWSLLDPSGAKLADITTRRDAEKLAALLNRVLRGSATPSP